MELTEAFERIVRGHIALILGLIAVGGMLGYVVYRNQPSYSATVRVLVAGPQPKSGAESTVIADSARAIVTSPSHVAAVLRDTGIQRDPTAFARDDVKVDGLGTSGIVEITVRDHDSRAAAAVANALAADLIQTQVQVDAAGVSEAVAVLEGRLKEADARIADLDARVGALNAEISRLRVEEAALAGNLSQQNLSIRKQQDDLDQRADLLQRRASLAAARERIAEDRDRIVNQAFVKPSASIVDPAVPPPLADRARNASYIGLGVVLGLVLGLTCAALIEVVKPTLIGRYAVARAAQAPLLGQLRAPPGKLPAADLKPLGTRLGIAARTTGVHVLELVAISPGPDLTGLADRLGTLSGREVHWFPADASAPDGQGDGIPKSVGMVLVAPTKLNKSALDKVHDLRGITGWPLLGVITYPQPSWRQSLARVARLVPHRR